MAAEMTVAPGVLMAALNRRLHGRGSGFTTCVALRVDPDGTVTVANAGHLQPYLDGREMELEAGLPLGFDVDAEYVETRFVLTAGERLALVTDGVVEAMNGKRELFGFVRTEAVSGETAGKIAGAAEGFGAAVAQADDITVLTVVRTAMA
jgi:serine phosphatase RsbU (regulator of sigma subunit)